MQGISMKIKLLLFLCIASAFVMAQEKLTDTTGSKLPKKCKEEGIANYLGSKPCIEPLDVCENWIQDSNAVKRDSLPENLLSLVRETCEKGHNSVEAKNKRLF